MLERYPGTEYLQEKFVRILKKEEEEMKEHKLTPELKTHFRKMFEVMEFVKLCEENAIDMPEVAETFRNIHNRMSEILKKKEEKK